MKNYFKNQNPYSNIQHPVSPKLVTRHVDQKHHIMRSRIYNLEIRKFSLLDTMSRKDDLRIDQYFYRFTE